MSIATHCKPRKSIFDKDRRDVVLDLSDLINDDIDAEKFFEENFVTKGMRLLIEKVFDKFANKNDSASVFSLTQSMGGGKTHNMIALGLLAKYPEIRKKVLKDFSFSEYDEVIKAVGFNGRESDAPYGIWGSIAEQLGKKDMFSEYYSPLKAPGESAWSNLLAGAPVIIFLDELPPYLDNASSITVGSSDLARVSKTALANLLIAANRLPNVCIILSDLTANYQSGRNIIESVLNDLKDEVKRSAYPIEPVAQNSTEVYDILKIRLFEKLPDDEVIEKIAHEYSNAVRKAKEMDVTSASPESFAAQIMESYPFHFSIRDLYGRFRENSGFQQTRGLIRLMRTIVSDLYESKKAEKIDLIHPYDFNLNNDEIFTEVKSINPALEEAMVHDIANNGNAVAEELDKTYGGTDAQDVAKLIYLSSLSDITNATQGLRIDEITSYLCAPGRDISRVRSEIIENLPTRSWYLHISQDERYLFKNVKNLAAQVHDLKRGYTKEIALKELKTFLDSLFRPQLKDCYQKIHVLPSLDEVEIEIDKVSLIIAEPAEDKYEDLNLSKDHVEFYKDQTYKNRIFFLTGNKNTMETVYDNIRMLKAIDSIIGGMETERVSQKDPQWVNAQNTKDKVVLSLRSSLQETFTQVIYPTKKGLRSTDINLTFTDNHFNGEELIKKTLIRVHKMEDDIDLETFTRKAEQRLFGNAKQTSWHEIKRRAATNTEWQFHKPGLLDEIRKYAVETGKWIDDGGLIEKGPFPPPSTYVRIKEVERDDETGEVKLQIFPINGDKVYVEYGGSEPTTASHQLSDFKAGYYTLKKDAMHIKVMCVDSSGEHKTGDIEEWHNKVTLKHSQIYLGSDGSRKIDLKAIPRGDIYYTTDGSDPKVHGAKYDGHITIPDNCNILLAIAKYENIYSNLLQISVPKDIDKFEVDPSKPLQWKVPYHNLTARKFYDFLERMKKYNAKAYSVSLDVDANDNKQQILYTASEDYPISGDDLDKIREMLQKPLSESGGSQLRLNVEILAFEKGQDLLDWFSEIKEKPKQEEIIQ